MVGSFEGTVDFDPGPGTTNKTAATSRDIFIAKYSPAGGLIWVDQVGGTGDDDGFGISLDGTGNVWVTGSFIGTVDFDPGPGTANLNSGAGFAPFVLRLNNNGGFSGVVGSTTPNFGRNQALAIANDNQGNAYITGEIGANGVFGGTTLTPTGNTDVFVAKVTPTGSNLAFTWTKSFPSAGGAPISQGNSIATDTQGNVYVSGMFAGTVNFPTPLTSAGNQDIFVAKLSQATGTTVTAQRFGGAQYDVGDSIVVDASQNSYLSGHYEGTVAFGGATAPLTSPAGGGIFVLKLNSSLQPLSATDLRASSQLVGFIGGSALAVDPVGTGVLVAGNFTGTAQPGGISLTSAGDTDVLIAQISSSGVVTGAQRGGGVGSDLVGGIAANPSGAIALVGQYSGTATFGASTLPNLGTQNMFVAQLSATPNPVAPHSVDGDFDGDGKTDYSVYEPKSGKLYIKPSNGSNPYFLQFGPTNNVPVPGDYDGDGKADYGVYEPSSGKLYIKPSNGSNPYFLQFGPTN
ncbi:MAG: VCBS repeat-containing protein, partial [Isosphaeraceae bacterium]